MKSIDGAIKVHEYPLNDKIRVEWKFTYNGDPVSMGMDMDADMSPSQTLAAKAHIGKILASEAKSSYSNFSYDLLEA